MTDFDKLYAQVRTGFARERVGELEWTYAPMLRESGVHHGFTTRKGGVSQGKMASLNLGWNRPEPLQNIECNFKRLARAAQFDYDSMALVNYVHGGNVLRAGKSDCKKGFDGSAFDECDGLITNEPGITLTTLHADCMCVFLFDPVSRAVGIAHAGWKGTSLRIGATAVQNMQKEFCSRGENLLCAISPSISERHFEVDTPVMQIFKKFAIDCIVYNAQTNKYHIDLWKVMVAQLIEAGVQAQNITVAGECTYDLQEDYFSFRRDGKGCGAMAGFIML